MRLLAAIVLMVALSIAGCGGGGSTPAERGSHYLRAGQYDDAITVLSEAVRTNPADADSYFNRGRAHHFRGDVGDLERAIDDFSDVIRLAPKDPEAYYHRAMAHRDLAAQYAASGDEAKAADESARSAADQQTARELDPRVTETYSQIPDTTPEPKVRFETPPAEEPVAEGEAKPTLEELLDSSKRGQIPPSNISKTPAARPSAPEPREDVRDLYRRRQKEQAARAARQKTEAEAALDPQTDGVDAMDRATAPSLEPRPSRSAATRRTRSPDLPPALRNPWSMPSDTPYGPRSPYGDSGVAGGQSPYQSPYAPRSARPAVTAEDAPFGPFRPAPRTLYDRSGTAPSNAPPIAKDYDFGR